MADNGNDFDIDDTPATICGENGEWAVTLNGYVLRQGKSRLPQTYVDSRLSISGKVVGNGELRGNPAAVSVSFSGQQIESVTVVELLEEISYAELNYTLSKPSEQPETGERWTTGRLDPEATVEILPLSDIKR